MLTVDNLSVSFGDRDVVRDVSFHVDPTDRLAIIGESGSGKTMTVMAILSLLPTGATATGHIYFHGQDLLALDDEELNKIRGNKIGCVFQEPATALNPVARIGTSLTMALRVHHGMTKAQARSKAVELADMVGLPQPEEIVRRYPHELSGGQRQRVVIAMALSCHPDLLLADEPTTALDATVQARILHLMDETSRDMARIMITHDMAVAYQTSTKLVAMKDGGIVASGNTADLITSPPHPYVAHLVEAARATGLDRHV